MSQGTRGTYINNQYPPPNAGATVNTIIDSATKEQTTTQIILIILRCFIVRLRSLQVSSTSFMWTEEHDT